MPEPALFSPAHKLPNGLTQRSVAPQRSLRALIWAERGKCALFHPLVSTLSNCRLPFPGQSLKRRHVIHTPASNGLRKVNYEGCTYSRKSQIATLAFSPREARRPFS